ncbi:DNA polymerase I, partial [Granulicatella adiacens]
DALMSFYKEMNFNSFQSDLLNSGAATVEGAPKAERPTVKRVAQISDNMLKSATSVHFETLEANYHVAEVIAVAFGNEKNVFVTDLDTAVASEVFKKWLSDASVEKHLFDTKAAKVLAHRFGFDLKGAKYDVSLLAYLVDTNDIVKEISDVARRVDVTILSSDEAVYGKGVKIQIPEDKEVWNQHLAAKVFTIAKAPEKLLKRLEENEQTHLYWEMELPLSDILARMEIQGIRVDRERLVEMGVEFEERLKEIEQEIYALAGEEFNINSTKQLGVILFEKMGLPVIKKTKTGYSTAVDVLEKLAHQAPIVELILEYRQLAKLNSTYVEGLQAYIQEDGKIHTRFIQNLTQTGRLSSVDPNLQNIPIRTKEGRRIRYAFLPEHDDWKILSSDYSQIELRVLAHIAGDKHMIEAFKNNVDIHTNTAMRVFGITNPEDVTSEMRRQAKAVNFGIVYGISDYGLSQNLNISRKRAKEFIDRYLEEFQGVKDFMESIVKEAREKDYVETLFHRRRYLPDIHSSNFNLRSFAERTAMNSPIQGSAADILKMAMIELDREMRERKFKANLLLQVHDELIFEVPQDELESLQSLVEEVMENAVSLKVPLRADSNVGDNWFEAK